FVPGHDRTKPLPLRPGPASLRQPEIAFPPSTCSMGQRLGVGSSSQRSAFRAALQGGKAGVLAASYLRSGSRPMRAAHAAMDAAQANTAIDARSVLTS